MHTPIYITQAKRTPIGAFLGAFKKQTAPELAGPVLNALIAASALDNDRLVAHLDEVILGCVVAAGIGQAPARQAARKAGISDSVGALTINKVCGSGLKAVMLASQALTLVDGPRIAIAGGMESMSSAPHYATGLRLGKKLGNITMVDAVVHDGLWDPYYACHMGSAAEQCVAKYNFSREAQDAYAKRSYERARHSIETGAFEDEVVAVANVSKDEQPYKDDFERLCSLKPAFDTEKGTITAGNASPLNDGAAAVMLANEAGVQQLGLKPMARIVAMAGYAQDPMWYTTAPIGAMQAALKQAGLSAEDIDTFEINEAFAAVAMAAIAELKLDDTKVNPRGGGVALGHPIGASGARILVTLAHTLAQTKGKYGLATLCLGGGEAVAVIVENLVS